MKFTKTVGHEKQKKLLEAARQNGRLAHAYCFSGPEHIGKTTFALELAEILGAHRIFDVLLSDSDETMGIEEVRNIQNRLNVAPVGALKVAIITNAERRLTLSSANALLKTLEQPPPHSLLLLTTANFYSLLPTIVSRLQRINFAPVWEAEYLIGLSRTLQNDEKLRNFFEEAQKYFAVLKVGSILERLKSSEAAAVWDDAQISFFVKYAMLEFVKQPGSPALAQKLLAAWRDLKFNLNLKLVLDNLFLPR